jgi:hypothetical protein
MTSASTGRARTVVGAVAVAAATVLIRFPWLGHDTAKTVDPLTGHASGPYAAWQVAGCLLSLAVVLVVADLRRGRR